CLASASNSLVANQGMIKKVYFPRLLYPIAPALGSLVDFMVGMIVLAALMVIYGIAPGVQAICFPIFSIMAALTRLTFGLWLGALNVRSRDVGAIVPFLATIWMYVSPILYTLETVQRKYPKFYPAILANPVTGIIEGFRWSLFGGGPAPVSLIINSMIVTL